MPFGVLFYHYNHFLSYLCTRAQRCSIDTMSRRFIYIMLFSLMATTLAAQEEDVGELPTEPIPFGIGKPLIRYRYNQFDIVEGDTMWTYLLPELPVYAPLVFRTEKERQKFNRMVANVKRVLPLAKQALSILDETYAVLESLPDKKSKDEHIKEVEKEIKRRYTPEMKKLTYSQGKLLIKLVDRECNQSSFEIVKAFLGPFRANFYQIFAWTFKASLKKKYDPEGDDRLVERIVVQVEMGQL